MKTLLPILLIISTSFFNQKGKYIVIKTDIKKQLSLPSLVFHFK